MIKKLMLLAVSVSAFVALAAPAQAALVLDGEGEPAKELLAVSQNFSIYVPGAGNIECRTTELNLTFSNNGEMDTEADATGTGLSYDDYPSEGCRVGQWGTYYHQVLEVTSMHLGPNGTGTASILFNASSPYFYPCQSVTEPASVSWNPSSSSFHIEGELKGSGKGLCVLSGGWFHADFDLAPGVIQ